MICFTSAQRLIIRVNAGHLVKLPKTAEKQAFAFYKVRSCNWDTLIIAIIICHKRQPYADFILKLRLICDHLNLDSEVDSSADEEESDDEDADDDDDESSFFGDSDSDSDTTESESEDELVQQGR